MKLIPNIELLIQNSGYKKNFIADKLGVSPRQLRKYEKGEAFIPMDKAFILSRLLNKKVDDLYKYVEENND